MPESGTRGSTSEQRTKREGAVSGLKDHRILRGVLAMLGLTLLYLIPRLDHIHQVMTVDESLWLGRSANFVNGLLFFRPMQTFQFAHPGVTTMWAGAVAYLIEAPGFVLHGFNPLTRVGDVHKPLQAAGIDPLTMMVDARISKLILQTMLFLIAIWLVDRLFDRRIAVATAIAISFDPFLIGHDRLLHIDGLLTISAFAAVLAFAYASRERSRNGLWMLAGLLFTVTCLTRTVGGVMLPMFVAVVFWHPARDVLRHRIDFREAWQRVRKPVLTFGIPALVSALVLWPALLWAPGIVATEVISWSLGAAEGGHELPIFFNGKITMGNPGFRFYPESMLWRLTPVTLAGIAIFTIGLLVRRDRFLPQAWRSAFTLLVTFGMLYVLLMTSGSKKFDRYVLPAYPIVELIAAIGWVGLFGLLWAHRDRVVRTLSAVAIGFVFIAQLDVVRTNSPYGLDYYNPLLGGMVGAEDTMLVGWGEGMDQAADYILTQPGGATAQIRTTANRTPLLYFLPPTATVYAWGIKSPPITIPEWASTDYYVTYILQWQRDLYPEIMHHLLMYPSAFTGKIDGVDVVRVYDVTDIPPPPETIDRLSCRWKFGDDVTLLTYTDARQVIPANTSRVLPSASTIPSGPPLPQSTPASPAEAVASEIEPGIRRADGAGRTVSLYFQSDSGRTTPLEVTVELNPRSDHASSTTQTTLLTPSSVPGALRMVSVDLSLPKGQLMASYTLTVTLRDPVTGEIVNSALLDKRGNPHDAEASAMISRCRPG